MKPVRVVLVLAIAAAGLITADAVAQDGPGAKPKPLMGDFMGLCVHTVMFKPDLYKPICRKVRDYHGLSWDVGKDTDFHPQFPYARNRVDWGRMYGKWREAGYDVNVSLMLNGIEASDWKHPEKDAYAYGLMFARFFGPSGRNKLVEAVEIGNEPGHYDDATYRKIFEHMAKGLRAGDPKLKIATCNLTLEKSGKYAKNVTCVKGLESLYDILNVHAYAMIERWPTWRRSFPEDPKIDYLKNLHALIAWRNANARGKEIWLTEFGWDACTKPASKTGTFSKWVDVTDEQQAQYLVRSFLVFSAMDLDRAYVYWFNDKDTPKLHGASGLTRDYQPKPAFHAVAHLQKTLGDYRFSRMVTEKPGDLYVYEFTHATDAGKRILVAWSPTGSGREVTGEIGHAPAQVVKVERMPMKPGAPERVPVIVTDLGTAGVRVGESPVYLFLKGR